MDNKEIFNPKREDIYIIAEAGKNFIHTEEDRPVAEYLHNAKELVDVAIETGVDAIKFQTHEIEDEFMPNLDVTSPHFTGSDRYSWITRNMNATPLDGFWRPLKEYCDARGITFISTPMSRKAAIKLEQLGVPYWKIGSGDVQDNVILDYIASTGKPLIISTGMVSLEELDAVVHYTWSKNITLAVLYCISQYPAPPELFNFSTMEYLREKYPDVTIGFSDHSLGLGAPLAAVKYGARIIEKHFTMSRDFWGADHKVSATPDEMSEMVSDIRGGAYKNLDASAYYGVKDKEMEGANNKFRPYFNKALIAGCDIPAGTVITSEMVFAMRPKMYIKGLPSEKFDDVVGKTTAKDLTKYDPIDEQSIN